MNYHCPNPQCQTSHIIKDGHFFRKSDSQNIQRFKCKACLVRFSRETHKLEYRQKKRRINFPLLKLLCSGVSMRRAALILGVNEKTISRKLVYLAKKARVKNCRFLSKFTKNKVSQLQFDDLITKETSKLLPVSVSLAVDQQTRVLLGTQVARIPAFGHLAKLSINKYGPRYCEHKQGLRKLFESLKPVVCEHCEISSDEHHHYAYFVRNYFPKAIYTQYKSSRAHIAGQGEMKKLGRDPLFFINHQCALLRANINRLIRKTWCVTKRIARLEDHLDIFTYFYNWYYLPTKKPPT